MSEWQDIETAPIKVRVVVGRSSWEGVTTAYWPSEEAKIYELKTWLDGPTHWLSGVDRPPHNPEKEE